jgi:hypothetical protein
LENNSSNTTSNPLLDSTHLQDLQKSGLTQNTINEASLKSVATGEIPKKLGFNVPHLVSMYEIPYDNTFSRYRAFYDKGKNAGPRYLQKKKSGNRLYIPYLVRPYLDNPDTPLNETEGEKKSLRACQEGILCIALSGLWSWSNGNGELINDYDQINLQNRIINIVPDNDWLKPDKHGYQKNLKQAVYRHAEKLIKRGARVFIVQLPPGELKGIDDYLCVHSKEDFENLPKIEVKSLAERVSNANENELHDLIAEISRVDSAVEREGLISALSERTGRSIKAIEKDIKKAEKPHVKEKEQPNFIANFPGLVEIVSDKDGNTVFLILKGNSLVLEKRYEVNGIICTPPSPDKLPHIVQTQKGLSKAEDVLYHYSHDDDQELFTDVQAYLKKFAYLSDRAWLIIAALVILSYLQDYPDIHYIPIILFRAVPERGKSRACKAALTISFRGIHLVSFSEANIFRYSEYFNATLYFDIMKIWKKAEQANAEDILLGRFEKGAMVSRVLYPDKGPFNDMRYFNIFGPTFISTNELAVQSILDTRAIIITPPNKPGRYVNHLPKEAAELRVRLLAFRARMLKENLPPVEYITELQGRLWDISQPLLQIITKMAPNSYEELKEELIDIAKKRLATRQESLEGRIALAINKFSEGGVFAWEIPVSDVLDEINKDLPDDKKFTSQKIGKRIEAMGLTTRKSVGKMLIQMDEEILESCVHNI